MFKTMQTKTLYRPVGLKELELIADADWKTFPPRLEWQPIFYPVLNQAYAEQIASEWNAPDAFSGYCGIVTKFYMDEGFIGKYNIENVGGAIHNELWVPAEELAAFNRHIQGNIEIVNAFFGKDFVLSENAAVREALLKFIK